MIEYILSLFLLQPTALQPKATSYQRVTEALKKIVNDHPQTSRIFQLGVADSGEVIWGLEISNQLQTPFLRGPQEVPDLIVGTHHGNEYGSTAVAMGLADSLAANPLNGHRIYLVPVLNIVGFNNQSRYETRKNQSYDPNRDYPGPCGTSGPFILKSTKALADFIEQKGIVASATLHTYAEAALYPWGISTRDLKTDYESTFIGLAKDSAVESGYAVGNSNELLYAADGTFEDYAFWRHGIWSLLFEMGDSHNPNAADLKKMIAGNVPGIRRFLENSPKLRAERHAFAGKCDTSVMKRVRLE